MAKEEIEDEKEVETVATESPGPDFATGAEPNADSPPRRRGDSDAPLAPLSTSGTFTSATAAQTAPAAALTSAAPAALSLLVLRGLPFTATEADIAAFVERAGVAHSLASERPISLLDDALGRPSGFAVLQLTGVADFHEVHRKLHMQHLGSRYVEALLPSQHEKWVTSAVAQWRVLTATGPARQGRPGHGARRARPSGRPGT